ncbi:DUF3313 domain-containing protein [Pseudomonas sp. BN411]|uniref:DUF3313 domain-containing protein n=1 Tax=Pseudomonas sp. BN411 TaxID=2567887 RepID=UPI002458E303|nr:DUF3313 domain-containing protein [Pseudomonas sp. BN411]MDH4563808.1 DUF3313 domain-containing protein [Pseudomonas sp. BN411]
MRLNPLVVSFSAILTLGGCSSTMVEPSHYSGFLPNYSVLQEQETASGAKVARWVDPSLDLSRYNSLYIEPSQFHPKPQPSQQISQATLDEITRYYDTALRREMGSVVKITDSPTADSLVLRPAITAVSASTEGLKPYEVIPIALVVAATTTAIGTRDQEVQIATEAMVLDGGTSKVVAEVVRKGTGTALENKETALTVQNIKPVIDGWAKDMRLSYEQIKNKR